MLGTVWFPEACLNLIVTVFANRQRSFLLQNAFDHSLGFSGH